MGFASQNNRSASSPAKVRYSWSGGEHLAEGKYRFSYYDKDKGENVEVKLPFEAWFLENTISIRGGGDGYYYWTNESAPASFDAPGSVMTLHKTTFGEDGSRNSEVIARGTYQQIKEAVGTRDGKGKLKLPSDMKYCQNYYFYNPKTKQIECIQMQGSFNSAFINFTSHNKGWANHKITFEQNSEPSKNGSVYYYEPKFTLGDIYNDEEMKLMGEQDKIVLDYIKSLYGEGGNDSADPTIDQTPKEYDGEQSQESEDGLSLSGVPF